jgi:hypothetical protein
MINMSMEVTSNYGGYATGAYDTTVKNNTAAKSDNSTNSVEEYYEKLCKKFPEITFNKSGGLASGNENKAVINLSNECLKKMASDPEFAKKVEFNLTGVVSGQNWLYAKAKADGAVIHGVTAVMDSDGNVSVTCGGMTRTSGSNQNSGLSNTGRQTKARLEKKAAEEKVAKSRAEKKAEEEKRAEKRAEKKANEEARAETPDYTVSATGTDIKTITQQVISISLGTSATTGGSFDIKA